MTGSDGRTKFLIDKKFTIYAAAFFLLIAAFIGWRMDHRPRAYESCSQIEMMTGRSYIQKGDPLYQDRLDRNHNGIACES